MQRFWKRADLECRRVRRDWDDVFRRCELVSVCVWCCIKYVCMCIYMIGVRVVRVSNINGN